MSYGPSNNGGYRFSSGNNMYSDRNQVQPEQPGTKASQLYMGDLDPFWDESVIRGIWASLGEPHVQVRLIRGTGNPGMGSGGNQGYCFVEFPSHLNASNALLKNGLPLPSFPGKVLKLNWASFATAPGNEHSIFVGDLAPNVNEAQLFELFISRFASTLNTKIVFDQMTGVSKGYGFVKFGSEAEQRRALLEMQGVFLNGRAIRVSTTSKNKPKYQQQPALQQQTDSAFGIDFAVRQQRQHQHQKFSQQQAQMRGLYAYPVQPQPQLSQFTDPNNTTVFIGGLSSLVTEEELRTYFEPFGPIVYVKIPLGKGCGFVQYVERISAETAIAKMQGFPIGNSRIRLSWGRSAKQAAAMQQAVASAFQDQQQQHQHQQQDQQQQLAASQQQAASNVPYQRQLAMPAVYGYATTWDSLNGGFGLFSQNASTSSFNDSAKPSANSLIPGLANMEFTSQPMRPGNSIGSNEQYASAVSQGFETFPQEFAVSARSGENGGLFAHPQITIQGHDIYVNRTAASIDRLEQGSNGFVFA
ncbi:LAMI_0C04082g1_1 [Lachancea mirantina]|uniref:LAMI_0C04082g1_1 n=1 Tax=Lachancea mirantina TaxID=1230905 RepID=A0A1G4J2R0_9SACH|nr:LAMI_0C04082g1_1 [Lachancea mirantina]